MIKATDTKIRKRVLGLVGKLDRKLEGSHRRITDGAPRKGDTEKVSLLAPVVDELTRISELA